MGSQQLASRLSGTLLVLAFFSASSHAQLFGNQTIGASPTQLRSPFGNNQGARGTTSLGAPTGQLGQPGQPGQPGGTGSGLLGGNERFVRGNRSRQDFVGTGRNDLTGFVGAGQAIGVGRVPAASDSFRLEATSAAKVNKPLPKQPTKGMYYPRLVLEVDPKSADTSALTVVASPEIQRRVQNVGGENVQVVLTGSTAILQGSVDSKRAAELVVKVLSFEPGIDRVENKLTVP